jgi:hypothetical protein
VPQLFISLNEAYDPVKREVLYGILTEFGIITKQVRLIKMCLNETYSKLLNPNAIKRGTEIMLDASKNTGQEVAHRLIQVHVHASKTECRDR